MKPIAFISQRVVFSDNVVPAIVIVENGKIANLIRSDGPEERFRVKTEYPDVVIEDVGNLVLMPGIVDSHVHVNEPGRTEWEGFFTATKAAAAGGVTTIADMPLNSIPPTTTVDNLKIKAKQAKGKTFVDVAFWGGVIPGNQRELRPLVDAGVVGFKCFLCPSGVDEFPNVTENDVEKALAELKSTNTTLAFHAEYESGSALSTDAEGDPTLYETFLHTRPTLMEKNAIRMVCQWCKSSKIPCHIVHLSAADALDMIKDAKSSGTPLSVETCYHYLTLSAEEVPRSATAFKCCPPIREKRNQDKLWSALKNGVLDMVVSDHSPCIQELKASGNFLTAWGGISSVQFGLSLLWTEGKSRDLKLHDLSRLISAGPAKLCRLNNRKGTLSIGFDADFVIWDPEQTFQVKASDILYKNKISPYMDRVLYGKVIATVLRGNYIYKDNQVMEQPQGNLLLKTLELD